ncbi:hypothetical protein BC827DRAFT_1246033 [Russula dissimulans]|nr:hypothetical protein BC827DRAFT_1246033 [Russula dissimulans]
MRPATVLSFFAASLALLSRGDHFLSGVRWIELTFVEPESPIAYAAPLPFPVDSAAAKRGCDFAYCRIAIGYDINTDTSSQSPTVQLAQVLLNALQEYLHGSSPSSNTTSIVELVSASPLEDTGSDDSTSVDDDLSTDAAALAGESL